MSSLRCGAESEGRAWGAFRIDAPVHRRDVGLAGRLAHRAFHAECDRNGGESSDGVQAQLHVLILKLVD